MIINWFRGVERLGACNMFQQVSVLVLAVGMAVSVAFREAFVNLFVDPPLVVCDGNWIVGCERVPGGLKFWQRMRQI